MTVLSIDISSIENIIRCRACEVAGRYKDSYKSSSSPAFILEKRSEPFA